MKYFCVLVQVIQDVCLLGHFYKDEVDESQTH